MGNENDERPSRLTASSKDDVPVSIQSWTDKRQTITGQFGLTVVSYNWHQTWHFYRGLSHLMFSHGSARATILHFGLSLVPHFSMHKPQLNSANRPNTDMRLIKTPHGLEVPQPEPAAQFPWLDIPQLLCRDSKHFPRSPLNRDPTTPSLTSQQWLQEVNP